MGFKEDVLDLVLRLEFENDFQTNENDLSDQFRTKTMNQLDNVANSFPIQKNIPKIHPEKLWNVFKLKETEEEVDWNDDTTLYDIVFTGTLEETNSWLEENKGKYDYVAESEQWNGTKEELFQQWKKEVLKKKTV
jgi:hypothetical protein